ncbi:MAG: DUF4386 domain-containing protein [Steroidobacteraceae bacterium]|jgi:hypothetical protein
MTSAASTNALAVPQAEARIAGVLYLVVIGTAFFAEMYARGSLVVSGDAIATARNILSAERLYRVTGVADLVNLVCDIGVAVILYRLLRPAGQTLSLYAALMRVAADMCLAVATFLHFAPLLFLRGAPCRSLRANCKLWRTNVFECTTSDTTSA